MKNLLSFFAGTILLILAATANISTADLESSGANSPRIRQIRYSFTLRNTTNPVLPHIDFWTYAPVPRNSVQHLVHLDVSSPYRIVTDSMGNQLLHFSLEDLPPYATRILSISAWVSFLDKSSPSPVGDLRPYLEAEKFIEANDPDLRRTAAVLKDPSLLRTAEQTFRAGFRSGNPLTDHS